MDLIVNAPLNIIEKYTAENKYQYLFACYLDRPDYHGWLRALNRMEYPVVLDLRGVDFAEIYADHRLRKLLWFGEFEGSIKFQKFLKAVVISPDQIQSSLAILSGLEADIELWIVENGDKEVSILTKNLPNIRPFIVRILLGKKLESLYKYGRTGLVDTLVKITDWDHPIDFSDVEFHLLGVWEGYKEVLGYKNSIFKSLITSYPIKLGLQGRRLAEDRPFLPPLNFQYSQETFNEWTHKNVSELREVLK